MRNSENSLTCDNHHGNPLYRLGSVKEPCPKGKVKGLPHVTHSQSQGIWDIANSDFKMRGVFAPVWQMVRDKSSTVTVIYTLASKKELSKIVNPPNDYG